MLLLSILSAWVAVSSSERAVARLERRVVCCRRREGSVALVLGVLGGWSAGVVAGCGVCGDVGAGGG